jgi:hypothetical protein
MAAITRLAMLATVLVTVTGGIIHTTETALAAPARPGAASEVGPAYAGRLVFKIVATVPGPRRATAQAWGAFKASGHFIRKTATITFPKGRIIVHRHVDKTTYDGPNLQTCRFTIVQRGTFSVKRATGRYRGLHDSGHFTSRLHGRLKKTGPGRCGSKIVAKRTVTFDVGRAR